MQKTLNQELQQSAAQIERLLALLNPVHAARESDAVPPAFPLQLSEVDVDVAFAGASDASVSDAGGGDRSGAASPVFLSETFERSLSFNNTDSSHAPLLSRPLSLCVSWPFLCSSLSPDFFFSQRN